MEIETVRHMFWECICAQTFWMQLKHYMNENGLEITITFKTSTFPDLCLLVPFWRSRTAGSNWCFFFSFAPELVGYSAPRDLHRRAAYSICES